MDRSNELMKQIKNESASLLTLIKDNLVDEDNEDFLLRVLDKIRDIEYAVDTRIEDINYEN